MGKLFPNPTNLHKKTHKINNLNIMSKTNDDFSSSENFITKSGICRLGAIFPIFGERDLYVGESAKASFCTSS